MINVQFELSEESKQPFLNMLYANLMSIKHQIPILEAALEGEQETEKKQNLGAYLADIVIQQAIVTQLVAATEAAKPKSRIIGPPNGGRLKGL